VLPLEGELTVVIIRDRGDVLGGQSFGAAGSYEFLRGELVYEVDPASSDGDEIPDLRLAERNARGKVVFRADFELLRPADPAKASGVLLYDVVNRGERTALQTFNRGSGSASPLEKSYYGDGFLFEQGYAVLWSGWQYDVNRLAGRIGLEAPTLHSPDGAIAGLVRAEFVPRAPASSFPIAPNGHRPIPIWRDSPRPVTLTVRDAPEGARRKIPQEQWRTVESSRIEIPGGFTPGKIYELIYPAKDPRLAAAGYLAVRDVLSAFKYGAEAAKGILSGGEYQRVYAFGNSQSGMFLRSFLYRGFNADAQGRPVMDAVFSSVAGARSVRLKERFAQPSNTTGPFRSFSYPSDLFPYSDRLQTDPVTGRIDGLLARAEKQGVAPKLFHVNSAYEYFGCGASLVHSTLDGRRDMALEPNTRVYMFAGAQHGPGRFPPRRGRAQNFLNHNDYHWAYRALLMALDRWTREDREPPASRYPRIEDGTLIPLDKLMLPAVPALKAPVRIHVPRRLDFGPEFDLKGIVDNQPPRLSESYVALVPQVDADGNDIAGVRMPEIAVPLGTYTGWNLRSPEIGASNDLLDSAGSFLAFAAGQDEREAARDPRRSIQERYETREAYLARYEGAGQELVDQGFLLPSDLPSVTERARLLWDWVMQETGQSAPRR
jgi:hypothetical protein